MSDQKTGILNAIEKVATVKAAEVITDHIVEVGADKVSLESLQELDGVSETAATRVIAALQLHTELSAVGTRKQREKKPSVAERYVEETSGEERNKLAIQVAELRINAEGKRPRAWRSIREELGLKNEQFHKVIRLSDGWKQAVANRINALLEQEGGWTYSGKLDVLTGIDNITLEEIKSIPRSDIPEETESQNNEVDLQEVAESAPRVIDTPAAA